MIGKGGAVIRALTEETGTQINIEDDGTVTIASVDEAAGAEARRRVEELAATVEVGKVYEGKVQRLLDFGAIVQVLPGRATVCCISARSLTNASIRSATISRKDEPFA